MIDFQNADFIKLKKSDNVGNDIEQLLIPGETIISSYKSIRDSVIFTNKRVISVNVQGVTGKKEIIHPFLIQKYKLFLLKPQEFLI